MTAVPNPVATEHLPFFITPPADSDVLLNIMIGFTFASVVLLGIVFLTIHSLPERMAHKSKKVQLDIVAVLCLLALFTNEHAYWIAALLLAFIEFPDLATPFRQMVAAVQAIAYQGGSGKPIPGGDLGDDTTKSTMSEVARPDGEAGPAEAPLRIQKGAAHA